MNKQELIETLEKLKKNSKRCIGIDKYEDYWRGKTEAYFNLIGLAKQLNEPQKPVVPKFVAEWFEENKDDLEFPIWELCVDSYGSKDEHGMLNWIQQSENNPIETLIRMKDGYEVEKSRWVVNEGDLVIRKGEHEAKVYFVESVDDDGILLVNGIKDEFFTDLDERSVGEGSINYFYENFRLLAKKENLEVEKVEV